MNFKLLIILLFALVLRIINLNQSLWLDEAAQISESAKPFGMLFDQSIVPHPPLYRILMHFWMNFGRTEVFLRFPSVIFGVCSIIVLYLLAIRFGKEWKLNDHKKKFFAYTSIFLLAINQYHIYYSQEFRPYSMVCLLGLLSTYFMISESWLFYLFSSIALIYSAYFGFFMIFGHLFYVLIFKKRLLKKFITPFVIICLSFIFYLPSFLKQISTLGIGMVKNVPGWAEAVSVPLYKILPLIFIKFTYGRISFENKFYYGMLFLIITLIYLLLIWNLMKKNRNAFIKIITLFTFPVLTAFIISLIMPVIAPQRLIFLLPILLLICSLGLLYQKKINRDPILFIIIIINISALFLYFHNPKYQREQWREAVKFVEEDGNDTSIALFVFPQPFGPWDYYQTNRIKSYGITKKLVVTDDDLSKLSSILTDRKRIYLFQYLTGLTDKDHKTQNTISFLGYGEKSIKDFPGVGFIYIYEKI